MDIHMPVASVSTASHRKITQVVAGRCCLHGGRAQILQADIMGSVAIPIDPAGYVRGRDADVDFSLAVPLGFTPPRQDAPKIAALLHIFHPDLAEELAGFLDH